VIWITIIIITTTTNTTIITITQSINLSLAEFVTKHHINMLPFCEETYR